MSSSSRTSEGPPAGVAGASSSSEETPATPAEPAEAAAVPSVGDRLRSLLSRRPDNWLTIVVVGLAAFSVGTVVGRLSDPGAPSPHSAGFATPDVLGDGDGRSVTTLGGAAEDLTALEALDRESMSRFARLPPECVQSGPRGPVWRLWFSDDFDGDEVDTDEWYLYDSPGNAGFGLRRPAAITVEDGLLVITARMIDGALVSGGMAHRTDQIYGRWEFRVRTDPDPSEATSGVVLTWPGSNDWPIDGENDMYETGRRAGRTPFRTYIHYGADNSQEHLTHFADGTEWHDIAMEWTADRIAMYRDGRFVGSISNEVAIPDVPHHMTIQLDAWADTMGAPVRMYVDWVRVYSYDPASRSC